MPRLTFALPAVILAAISFVLSFVTATARARLYLGPQTPLLFAVGLATCTLAAIFAWRLSRGRDAPSLETPAIPARWIAPLVVACALLSLIIFRFAFHAFANSADENGFLFEAVTFLKGRLTNAEPPDPALFNQQYVLARDGIWVGQYLPGWPAILAFFYALRLPVWLATPVCAGLLLTALWIALRIECRSRALAVALLLAYATSGFFLLNGATFFSHCASGLFVVATIAAMLQAERDPAGRWPVLAGLFVGAAFLCRLDSGVLATTAALLAWAERRFERRMLGQGILGILPPLAAFCLYNGIVTGNPLLPPTAWGGNFTIGANGIAGVEEGHQRFRVAVQTLWRLGELADTASLLILGLYLAAMAHRIRTWRIRFYDAVPVVNFLIFAVFPDLGGFQMGPRYWFDGYAVMNLTIASVFALRVTPTRRFAIACVLLTIPISLARLPEQVHFEARVGDERATLFKLADALPSAGHTVVLVHDFPSTFNDRMNRTHWQNATDFTRNGPDIGEQRLLYARADVPDALGRTCALYPDASIYEFEMDWSHPQGRMQPLKCGNAG